MSRHRAPGRRRAHGAVRRLPDGFPRLSASWAVKSVASIGVVGGAAAALALPVGAEPGAAALSLPTATTSAVEGRAADVASRSAARSAPEPAVSAPAEAAPAAPETVGVTGLKAVAKPTPKPQARSTASKSPSGGGDTSYVKVSGIAAKCSGIGLTTTAKVLCTAVENKYGIPSIGGYRPNAGEHSTGQAIDFMIGSSSEGDAVAAFVQANYSRYNVKYIIWQQRYWAPGEGWSMMEDRGSPTANHMDHVHVTVN
ncbi:hypothetical protein ACK8HX_08760 [Oryzobacter sp. R7]|uniref:hypothetical protein n=1 Tax=Oryzobacter faecalis TaxID=3388656 RepID=UPI00398CB775